MLFKSLFAFLLLIAFARSIGFEETEFSNRAELIKGEYLILWNVKSDRKTLDIGLIIRGNKVLKKKFYKI